MIHKKLNINLLIIILGFVHWVFIPSECSSQNLYGEVAELLSVDNGLHDHYVKKMAEDGQGFIWILTDKGISTDPEFFIIIDEKRGNQIMR